MSKLWKCLYGSIVLQFFLLTFLLQSAQAQQQQGASFQKKITSLTGSIRSGEESKRRKGIDMVFLVDISQSMDDLFEDVRVALIDYVEKALVGDRIVIISFGERARLEVNKSIESSYDRSAIIKTINGLYPKDYSTYIVAAVSEGLDVLTELRSAENPNIGYLFLITDGKNNPPKNISNPLTFDHILKSYEGFRPGQDWFMYYVTLRNVTDNSTQDFVMEVGGGIENIESSSLAECINQTQLLVLAKVTDAFDAVEIKRSGYESWIPVDVGTPLREGDILKTGMEATAVIRFSGYGSTGIGGDTEIQLSRARLNPVSESVDISIKLIKGNLTNAFNEKSGYLSRFSIETDAGTSYVGGGDTGHE